MKRYKVYLKHDNGLSEVVTVALSIAQAVKTVMSAESCPERAIYKIVIQEVSK